MRRLLLLLTSTCMAVADFVAAAGPAEVVTAPVRLPRQSRDPRGNKTTRASPALAERTRMRQLEKPVLYLLVLFVALLAGCGSAGKSGTFSSQNYGYSAALPAGWAGRQAQSQWIGGGSPGFEDSDVDVFTGPNGIIVIAYGKATSQNLAAYTKANLQATASSHQCPAVPKSDRAITVGGAPARLLNAPCQGLSIETAITIHAGKGIVFVSQLSSGTRADRAAFRRFLAGIQFPQ